MSTISGVHTVGVPVTDQDAAVAFYTGPLGFEVRRDAPVGGRGARWIEVAPPGSPVTVALIREHDGAPAGGEHGIRFTTADAAALHLTLSDGGVDVGELRERPGVPPMFAFRDQDGNGLEIVQA